MGTLQLDRRTENPVVVTTFANENPAKIVTFLTVANALEDDFPPFWD